MSSAVLRRPTILPFFNLYTLVGFAVLAYLGLLLYLRLVWGAKSGIEYLYILMLVQLTPIVIAFTRRHFTYLAIIMIYHFLHLGIPKWIMFMENPNLIETFPEVLTAIQEQIFCTLITIFVYYACRTFLFSAAPEKERFQLVTLNRMQVSILCCYVLFVPLFLHKLPAWFLSVHFLLLSADLVLLFTSHYPGNEWLVRLTKIAAIVGSFNYFLTYGMMTLMGAMVSIGMLIFLLRKKFFLAAFLIVPVLGMSAIQTVKGPFRNIILGEMNEQLDTLDRFGVLMELLQAKYFYDEDTDVEEEEGEGHKKEETLAGNLIRGFMRAGDDSLERVLAKTPSTVPYWGGETYENLPFMFIPRVLWPDKPSRHFWNKYGRVYGILDQEDFNTSVAVSYLAEAYMNFGYSGMYLVATIVGFIFAFVERSAFFVLNGHYYFSYMVLIAPLGSPDSDLGSMLSSLWLIYSVFFIARPMLLRMAQRDEYS